MGGLAPRRSALSPNADAVAKTAAALVSEHGAIEAFRQAQQHLRLARRARSRKQYAFWAAVGLELEALAEDAKVQLTVGRKRA